MFQEYAPGLKPVEGAEETVVRITERQGHLSTISIRLLSDLSGVDMESLSLFLSGELRPHQAHIERLNEVLNELGADRNFKELMDGREFSLSDVAKPLSFHKKVPRGRKVIRQLSVRNLRVGDLVAYVPVGNDDPRFHKWVRVTSVPSETGNQQIGAFSLIGFEGSAQPVRIRSEAAFKVARLRSPDEE